MVSIFSKLKDYKFKIFDSSTKTNFQIDNCEIFKTGDDIFFNAILNCKGVICGAGFELPAEVLYLKKRLYVIPIGNQYEQKCNAESLIQMGVTSNDRLNKNHLFQWLESDIDLTLNLKLFHSQDIVDIINL